MEHMCGKRAVPLGARRPQRDLKAMRSGARLVQPTHEFSEDEVGELQLSIRMKAYTKQLQKEIELAFVRARGQPWLPRDRGHGRGRRDAH